MAKLNYVEGDYKEALNIYARVGLDDLPLTAVPPYRLRMIAEAYATKGEPAPARPWGFPPAHALWSQQSPLQPAVTPVPSAGATLWPLPARALESAPLQALDNFKPRNTVFPQSLSSSIVTEGNEGKTFEQSFLIINMQLK